MYEMYLSHLSFLNLRHSLLAFICTTYMCASSHHCVTGSTVTAWSRTAEQGILIHREHHN